MGKNDKRIKQKLQIPLGVGTGENNVDNRKKALITLGEKYVEWFDKHIVDFKTFWLNEFVYPILSPIITMSILRYIFKYVFTREEGMILFALFYLMTLTGRLLSKYRKLVDTLDPLLDKIMDIEKRTVKDGRSKKKKRKN